MSDDTIKELNQKILRLEDELKDKNNEIENYQQELMKFSLRLDQLVFDLSADLKYLSEIQKILAPVELPQSPGFEISRKFVYGTKSGGDFFDFFDFEDKFRFGLLVASSSGYAMSALFLSLILKFSHILQAKKGMRSEAMMQKLAEELRMTASTSDLTQAFYAVIDRRDYSFEFTSVGNIFGFYLAPGKSLQVLKSSAPPFGKNFNHTLSSVHYELEPKSRVCVMTNGLSDVLGLESIAQILTDFRQATVHEVRNELLFQAAKKTQLEEPLRDQTVVVIDVKDKVIKLAKMT